MGIGNWFKERFGKEEEVQQETEELVGCARCGFEYPVSSMKFGEDGTFCSDCLPLHIKAKEEAEYKAKQQELLSKVKYYCHNCKFHFSRKKDFQIGACPNCGSDNFTPESKLV